MPFGQTQRKQRQKDQSMHSFPLFFSEEKTQTVTQGAFEIVLDAQLGVSQVALVSVEDERLGVVLLLLKDVCEVIDRKLHVCLLSIDKQFDTFFFFFFPRWFGFGFVRNESEGLT
jgi:hypothetical protein